MAEKDYSHRDITDKLGLKPGHAVKIVGRGDPDLLQRVREKIGRGFIKTGLADVVLYWPKTTGEITPALIELRNAIVENGGIWVMTAKRNQRSASGMEYLNQTDLILLGKTTGLVDNKICSVSETESAMRFVIRIKDRKAGA